MFCYLFISCGPQILNLKRDTALVLFCFSWATDMDEPNYALSANFIYHYLDALSVGSVAPLDQLAQVTRSRHLGMNIAIILGSVSRVNVNLTVHCISYPHGYNVESNTHVKLSQISSGYWQSSPLIMWLLRACPRSHPSLCLEFVVEIRLMGNKTLPTVAMNMVL